MRIFLYEFITGGGLLADDAPPGGSLLAEGRAMALALAEDLSQVDGVEVALMRDARLECNLPTACRVVEVADQHQEREMFAGLASACDATIVIAPEFDGILLNRSEAVLAAGGSLLSCPPETIRIAADKQRTAELLSDAGVPVPAGRLIEPGAQLSFEDARGMILKPNDGAGSMGVRRVESPETLPTELGESMWRLEEYCRGKPASCAVLCGTSSQVSLPACAQYIDHDSAFAYLGGSVMYDSQQSRRARELAERAVSAMSNPTGYVGVDMILGEAADGSDDFVIEVNPRLTTSYVGLSEVAETNLAAAMLDIAQGDEPHVRWREGCVEFDADGTIRRASTVLSR